MFTVPARIGLVSTTWLYTWFVFFCLFPLFCLQYSCVCVSSFLFYLRTSSLYASLFLYFMFYIIFYSTVLVYIYWNHTSHSSLCGLSVPLYTYSLPWTLISISMQYSSCGQSVLERGVPPKVRLRMIVGCCIALCLSAGIYIVQESWGANHLWIHMAAYNT
jgi:hypothetical protein